MSTAPFIESFFDENYNEPGKCLNFKLWNKTHDVIDPKSFLYEGPLYKSGKKQNTYKLRYYRITSEKIYCYKNKNDTKPKCECLLNNLRIEYFNNQLSLEHKNGIKFIKNLKYFTLFAKTSEQLSEWRDLLSRFCVQSDFHTKFSVIKMIGKGSFAKVYLVEIKEKNKKYAVKAFSKEYVNSQNKGRDSLLNEIQLLKIMNHPSILHLEEIHESKNSIYLVLELLEGGELIQKINQKAEISICTLMRNLLDALAYLSLKGIMHRDLKPENIIFREKNNMSNIALVDFGLATLEDVSEYLFKRCGTPGFVAPEIINANQEKVVRYTTKCDVFSAGVIFYLLLTGKFLFEGANFKDVLEKNKECKIDFNNPILKNVDPKALSLLKSMLEISPEKRISAKDAILQPYFHEINKEYHSKLPSATISESIAQNIKKAHEQYATLKKDENSASSLVMQSNYITGEIDSVGGNSRNELKEKNAPDSLFKNSVDFSSPLKIQRGMSERGLKKNDNLYKMTLQKNQKPSEEQIGPVLSLNNNHLGVPDSYNSFNSEEEEKNSHSSEEELGTPSTQIIPKQKGSDMEVHKLKMKASSFRNPKPTS